MKPFWHPLSTILLVDPPSLATAHLVRILLRASTDVDLVYAGDRMGPTVAHGARIVVGPFDPATLAPGDVVLAAVDETPDLLRVLRRDTESVWLGADSDPSDVGPVPLGAVLARASLPARRVSRSVRQMRRLLADLSEARTVHDAAGSDPAASVREKYDAQAVFYARSTAADLENGLRARILGRVPAGGRFLVVGSGTGRECFALAGAGWQVTGLDFARAMVEAARREALRRGVAAEFVAGDLREYELPCECLSGVLFTYDVYSFLPGSAERVRILRKIREWLRPGGIVFLSARTLQGSYARWILTVQRLSGMRRRGAEWGDSHTRWISTEGTLHRSFVRYFTDGQLRAEITRAGFHLDEWRDGHGALSVESA